MKLRIIVVLCTLFSFALNACAQDIKRPDSYNYIRGIEAVESRDFQSALEYLNKEIEKTLKTDMHIRGLPSFVNKTKNMEKL